MKGKMKRYIFFFLFLLCSRLLMELQADGRPMKVRTLSFFIRKVMKDRPWKPFIILKITGAVSWSWQVTKRNFKTIVVLQDIGLYTNAYANGLKNKISIFTTIPETDSQLGNYENWFRTVGIHEYTHIAQMTNYSGVYLLLNLLFGNYMLPNAYNPDWIVEGIAVYSESIRSPYEGRLNDGYFDGVVASKAAAGRLPSLIEITYRDNHYPGGHWYLYGGEFLDYLAETYGEEKFAGYFKRVGADSNITSTGLIYPSLGIDWIARQVYGYTFPELFKQWQEHMEEKYRDWKIEGEKLVENENGRIFGLTYDSGNLYYFKERFLEPGPFETKVIVQLAEYNLKTGGERILVQLNGDANPFLQVQDGKVYYAEKVLDGDYPNLDFDGFGYTARLSSYDLKTRKKTEIMKTEFKDFLVLPDGDILLYPGPRGWDRFRALVLPAGRTAPVGRSQ